MDYNDMGAKFHAFFSNQVQIGGVLKETLNNDKNKCSDNKHNINNRTYNDKDNNKNEHHKTHHLGNT